MENGVINLISGLLLRAGNCDFSADSSYNPDLELQVSSPPFEVYVVNDPFYPDSEFITHWTGSEWDQVARI